MNEVPLIKKITIIRVLTMLGGFLGAVLLLYEQEFFVELSYGLVSIPNIFIVAVGIFCFINMVRHLRILVKLSQRTGE